MSSDGPPRLVVGVTDIRRHLGTRKPVHASMVADDFALSGVAVVAGAELAFDGEVESIADGVVLTGEATVPWIGTCRRCLDEVTGSSTVDIREVYSAHPVDGETWPLENDEIDLGPLLHDTALLALPLAPLCGPDCAGPAPEAFPTGPAAAVEPPTDPRWAGLEGLSFDE